jgi:hypothetical protein
MRRKLLYYFESHPIRVVISFRLREIIRNRLTMGRIAKWALELMGLNISYEPQTVIKSHALWILWLNGPRLSSHLSVTQEQWSMYFDGSFTLNGAGGGIVLIFPKGDQLLYVIRLHFRTNNNVAEYEVLVNGLRIAAELWV